MTRKDFKLIAETIARFRKVSGLWADECAEWFAESLSQTNPRFDKAKFLKACKGE